MSHPGHAWIQPAGIVALGLLIGMLLAATEARPIDSDMVWTAANSSSYYGDVWVLQRGSMYVYPPVLVQVVGLVAPLGWVPFIIAWEVILFAGLWFAVGRWSLLLIVASIVATIAWGAESPGAKVTTQLLKGNIQVLVAAAIVVGFRRPWAWAFVLLTKIGPGIGLLWFVGRRDWRSLGIALGTTVLVVAVSFVLAPTAWTDFVRFAIANAGTPAPIPVVGIPLVVRLPVAAAVLLWAGWTNRQWPVPVAAAAGSFALYEWSWIVFAAASVAMYLREVDRDGLVVRPEPVDVQVVEGPGAVGPEAERAVAPAGD